MIERRGEVWWADLGEPHGSAPAGRRPVLVVSADSYNGSRIATVVCLVITSNPSRAEQPGNVVLEPTPGNGLTKRSVVNVSQVVTLDRADLTDVAGAVTATTMRQVDVGLRLVLGLHRPPCCAGAQDAPDRDGECNRVHDVTETTEELHP